MRFLRPVTELVVNKLTSLGLELLPNGNMAPVQGKSTFRPRVHSRLFLGWTMSCCSVSSFICCDCLVFRVNFRKAKTMERNQQFSIGFSTIIVDSVCFVSPASVRILIGGVSSPSTEDAAGWSVLSMLAERTVFCGHAALKSTCMHLKTCKSNVQNDWLNSHLHSVSFSFCGSNYKFKEEDF